MKLICLIIEELGWTAPREVKSNNQLFFSLRMGRKDWFWFLFAEQRGPLAAYQLMKLIEWSQGCLMGWSCFWVGGWFGGLWALQRQWLRQRKQTQPNKSNEIQSNNAAAMKRKEWNWMNVMNEIEFLRLIGCSPHAEQRKAKAMARHLKNEMWWVMAAGPLRSRTPFHQIFQFDFIPPALLSSFLLLSLWAELWWRNGWVD